MGAHDDDYPFTTFDFLDNIFVDRSKTVSNVYSTVETIWGERNKVGVDIRFRVRCVQHFYRADCTQYCLARNDNNNGHYTCNQEDGSKICNSGYEHPEINCVDCECISFLFSRVSEKHRKSIVLTPTLYIWAL